MNEYRTILVNLMRSCRLLVACVLFYFSIAQFTLDGFLVCAGELQLYTDMEMYGILNF